MIFKEDKPYYTITDDGIKKLKFQNDSLFLVRIYAPVYDVNNNADEKEDVERTTYRIKESEVFQNKTILFLQNEETKGAIKKCFLIFDSTKNSLSLLLEDTLFNSIKAARKFSPDFENKFLLTFYSKASMNKFSNYKSVFTLDSLAKVNLVNEFIENVLKNKKRINNTKSRGILFLSFRDIITNSFLEKKLNPFIDVDSVNILIKDNEFIKNLD